MSHTRLVGWLVVMAVVGLIVWFIDHSRVGFDCFYGPQHGGEAESLGVAAVLGIVLWLAAAVAAWRLRRERSVFLVLVAFVALYVGGLVVLWALSPTIWGPRVCPQYPL